MRKKSFVNEKITTISINNFNMTPKQIAFVKEVEPYYLAKVYELEDIFEDLKTVNFIKRFFHKLHDNKLINVQLLVNHEIILYNTFNNTWITNHQLRVIPDEHKTYLKTILLYIHKIRLDDARFIDIPFSFDLDYLLQTKAKRADWMEYPETF